MKKWTFLGISVLLAGVLAACSGDEESGSEAETQDVQEEETAPELLNPGLAEELDADMEYIFGASDLEERFSMYDAVYTLPAYDVVKVTDVKSEEFAVFGDQNEGYILTVDVRLANEREEDTWLNSTGSIVNNAFPEDLLAIPVFDSASEGELKSQDPEDKQRFEPGEESEGMLTFALTNEEFEGLEDDLNFLSLTVTLSQEKGEPGVTPTKTPYSGKYVMDLPVNEEQQAQAEEQRDLYRDLILLENFAAKSVYFEEEINETKSIGDVSLTFEGIQYADLTVTPGRESLFSAFPEGEEMVSVTAKFQVDNQSDESLNVNGMFAQMAQSDTMYARNQQIAEPNALFAMPGDTVDKYFVFVMPKDEVEMLEGSELRIPSLFNERSEIMYDGEGTAFELPFPQ